MKSSFLSACTALVACLCIALNASSQLRITMVNPANNTLRIKNFSAAPIDISTYRLCALFEYSNLNDASVSVISGDFSLSQNEEVVLQWNAMTGFNATSSDLGLYLPTGAFTSAASMVDFVQYGAGGQGREYVAVAAGIWAVGTFLQTGSGPWVFNGTGTQSGINFWVSAVEVTFKVNMALQTVNSNGVHIAGNFQNWNPATTLMSDANNDAVYEYTTLLAAGSQIQFKYVNGNAWGPNLDESVPGSCGVANGVGGFNRFATLAAGGSQILGPVCFTQCANCVIEGCMDSSACNFDNHATISDSSCTYAGCQDSTAYNYDATAGCSGPCIYADVDVTFKVNMSDVNVDANGVHLAGNFQGWNPTSTEMFDNDGDGIYEVTFSTIANQSFQFKFINGNVWSQSEQVPAQCGVVVGFNLFNRQILIDSTDVVFGPVCFGECFDCVDIVEGCMDNNACNFDSLANTPVDICTYPGCTDTLAFNFSPDAGCADTCIYTDILVTFRVNMANEIVSANGVHFAGSLQGWNPSSTPMQDTDGDNIYEVTLPAVSNQSYAFKFINGNDWNFSEIVPLTCGVNDGSGNINRIIATGESNSVFGPICFSSCYDCGDIVLGCMDTSACNFDSLANTADNSCTYSGCQDSAAYNYDAFAGCLGPCIYADINVTFKVNMSNVTVDTNGVHLAGSIQGWNPSSTEMTDTDGDGIYEVTLSTIANQMYRFKFINGMDWTNEETVPMGCGTANEFGGYDREISIDSTDVVFGPVCFGACVDCGDIVLGCMDTAACNFDASANVLDNSCSYPGCLDTLAYNYSPLAGCEDSCIYSDITITFKLNMMNEIVSANGVHLAGSIQGWNPSSTEMFDNDGDGIYEVTLSAAAGQTYQFKFINGNDWPFAEQVPAECGVDDGFGGFNRSIVVASSNYTFGPVCFSNCVNCVAGCLDALACNYDPTAGISDSSLCLYPGCTDSTACNYSVSAGCLDLSCLYDVIVNEEYTANENGTFSYNGSDLVPGSYSFTYDAMNGCDSIVNVIIIDPQLVGCGIPSACNYNPIAGVTIDSLCVLPGCLVEIACNFNPNAECGGGACYYNTEVSFTQIFNEAFTYNDSLIIQPGIYEFTLVTEAGCDSVVTLFVLDPGITDCYDSAACNFNPLAGVIANFLCVYPGCQDSLACNYDANAGCTDNSCTYAGCTLVNACNFNSTAGCDDGSCIFPGCTQIDACNYDATAGCDDGSCDAIIGSLCDDGDSLTVSDSIGVGCLCVGVTVVSVSELFSHDILVYPNPAGERIFIQMPDISVATMQIISIIGEKVYSGKAMNQLAVNQLQPGIYILQIEKNGVISNRRIEIVR